MSGAERLDRFVDRFGVAAVFLCGVVPFWIGATLLVLATMGWPAAQLPLVGAGVPVLTVAVLALAERKWFR